MLGYQPTLLLGFIITYARLIRPYHRTRIRICQPQQPRRQDLHRHHLVCCRKPFSHPANPEQHHWICISHRVPPLGQLRSITVSTGSSQLTKVPATVTQMTSPLNINWLLQHGSRTVISIPPEEDPVTGDRTCPQLLNSSSPRVLVLTKSHSAAVRQTTCNYPVPSQSRVSENLSCWKGNALFPWDWQEQNCALGSVSKCSQEFLESIFTSTTTLPHAQRLLQAFYVANGK